MQNLPHVGCAENYFYQSVQYNVGHAEPFRPGTYFFYTSILTGYHTHSLSTKTLLFPRASDILGENIEIKEMRLLHTQLQLPLASYHLTTIEAVFFYASLECMSIYLISKLSTSLDSGLTEEIHLHLQPRWSLSTVLIGLWSFAIHPALMLAVRAAQHLQPSQTMNCSVWHQK